MVTGNSYLDLVIVSGMFKNGYMILKGTIIILNIFLKPGSVQDFCVF